MKIKCLGIVVAFLCLQVSSFGQEGNTFFYDTLTIMDYSTNAASERLSQMRKPIKRTFYLKNDAVSYTLFKGNVANLNAEQIMTIIDDGFSLYIDKLEHMGHKNLKPSVLEVMDEDNNVIVTIEDIDKLKTSKLKRELGKGTSYRFSGFMISVNEKKHGPIMMDVKLLEE